MKYILDNGDESDDGTSTLAKVVILATITEWAETQLRELDQRKAGGRDMDLKVLGPRVCHMLDSVERELELLARASDARMWDILGECEVMEDENR